MVKPRKAQSLKAPGWYRLVSLCSMSEMTSVVNKWYEGHSLPPSRASPPPGVLGDVFIVGAIVLESISGIRRKMF